MVYAQQAILSVALVLLTSAIVLLVQYALFVARNHPRKDAGRKALEEG